VITAVGITAVGVFVALTPVITLPGGSSWAPMRAGANQGTAQVIVLSIGIEL
jgi:hypothetical protein